MFDAAADVATTAAPTTAAARADGRSRRPGRTARWEGPAAGPRRSVAGAPLSTTDTPPMSDIHGGRRLRRAEVVARWILN